MRILIIEDEIAAYNNLKRLVKNCYDNSLVIIKWLTSISDSLEWFSLNKEPDLLLIDIHLSDGLVFELLERIEVQCPIIFTTAYDTYSLKAFNYNTSNYLLKPISQNRFDQMIVKVKKNIPFNNKPSFSDFLSALEDFQEEPKYKERFLVKKQDSYYVIHVSDIAFIHIDAAVILQTVSGERFIMNSSLEELGRALDPMRFFRCNRQIIINIQSIKKVSAYYKNSLLVILNKKIDFKIIVGKDKVKLFKQWMNK